MSETRKSADRVAEPPTKAGLGSETTVRLSISVAVDVERAFRVFSEQMSSWWPPEHHINDAPMAAAILEPRVGGRWYELGTDGSECEWGWCSHGTRPTTWRSPGTSTATSCTTLRSSVRVASTSASALSAPLRPGRPWRWGLRAHVPSHVDAVRPLLIP